MVSLVYFDVRNLFASETFPVRDFAQNSWACFEEILFHLYTTCK